MASRPHGRQKRTMKFAARPDSRPTRTQMGRVKPRKLSDRSSDGAEEDDLDEKLCCLCCEEMQIFAKGCCDHVICYRCSSRMRVLCEQKYCAVCRMDLEQVAFIGIPVPFKELTVMKMTKAGKFGILFENTEVKKAFEDLLLNICVLCENSKDFKNFGELRRHVRQEHDRQFCDICVKNVKIFPREFRTYTRTELVSHRKAGDVDDKSHKGHPQCDFCSERYYDNEELFLHLRRNHFWCHFCENDGKQEYYSAYADLRSHFQTEHFLCEENECQHEKFTSVFRTDIDYQAHKVAKHSKKLSKAAAKQARQLNVDIDYGPRSNQNPRTYSGRNRRLAQDKENMTSKYSPAVAESTEAGAVGFIPEANGDVDPSKPLDQKDFPLLNQQPEKDLLATGAVPSMTSGTVGCQPLIADLIKKKGTTEEDPKKMQTNISNDTWSKFNHAVDISCERAFPSLVQNGAIPKSKSETSTEKTLKKKAKAAMPPEKNSISVSPRISGATHSETKNHQMKAKAPPGITMRNDESARKPYRPPPGLSSKIDCVNPIQAENQTMLPAANKWVLKQSTPEPEQHSSISLPTSYSTKQRNISLVNMIKSLLSEKDFYQFKDLSGSFRRAEINASDYYSSISHILGENLPLVFFELVDLLPDINKQEELLKIHNSTLQKEIGRTNNKGTTDMRWQHTAATRKLKKKQDSREPASQDKNAVAENGNQESGKSVKKKGKETVLCQECGSFVFKKDIVIHMDSHAENDFPALPVAAKKNKLPIWRQYAAPAQTAWGKPK